MGKPVIGEVVVLPFPQPVFNPVRIVFEDVLEITERVQLGIVTDEDFNRLHAAVARRRLREASAAK